MELEKADWDDGKGFQCKIELEGCIDAVLGHQNTRQTAEDAPAQRGKHALLPVMTVLYTSLHSEADELACGRACNGLLVLRASTSNVLRCASSASR